jgi:hypothetical protein
MFGLVLFRLRGWVRDWKYRHRGSIRGESVEAVAPGHHVNNPVTDRRRIQDIYFTTNWIVYIERRIQIARFACIREQEFCGSDITIGRARIAGKTATAEFIPFGIEMIVGINQESSPCIPILIQIFYSHNMVVGRASLLKLPIPPASASEPEVRDVRLARIRRGSIRMKGVEKGTLT